MTTDLDQLIQNFQDYFVGLYRKSGAPGADTSPAFLAFETIGTAITSDMFELATGTFSNQLALEQFSTIANTLPVLDGNTITNPSIKTADGLYELMVFSAKATPGTDTGPFDRFRSNADQAFDTSRIPNLLPTGRPFHPAVATPPDWCAPQNAGGWTSTSFSHTEKTESSVSVGEPPPPPPAPVRTWNMRVLSAEMKPALESPVAVERVMPQLRMRMLQRDGIEQGAMLSTHLRASAAVPRGLTARGAGVGQMTANWQTAVPPHIQALAQESAKVSVEPPAPMRRALPESFAVGRISPGVDTQIHVASSQRVAIVMRADVLAAQTMTLNAAASVREVTSNAISLSFEYCLVNVTRPWLSTEFLSLKNWYMDDFHDGELASGSGVGGKPLEVMPVAALVVRKLSIKADWSHEDQTSLQNMLSFGPFSLQGRNVNQTKGEITCADMQIVAWVCEPMPKLPPAADPALATPVQGPVVQGSPA